MSAAALCVVACVHGAGSLDPAALAGVYRLHGAHRAVLEVRREEGRFLAILSGGGAASDGAASAADCLVRATGELQANRFVGTIAALRTDTFSYDAARARSEQRAIEIELRRDFAVVSRAEVDGYCGLGTQFLGTYRRES